MLDSECTLGTKVICVKGSFHCISNIGIIGYVVRTYSNGIDTIEYKVYSTSGIQIGDSYDDLSVWDKYYPNIVPTVSFIKATREECPCGIHRTDCDYHKV